MTVESASFLDALNTAYPQAADKKKEGDDHIRLIKTVLKATFPGLSGRIWRVQEKSSGYTIIATDNMTIIYCTAAITLALTAAATLGNGFRVAIFAGSGDVIIDPAGSETVDDAATVTVSSGASIELVCDGDEFFSFSGATLDGGIY